MINARKLLAGVAVWLMMHGGLAAGEETRPVHDVEQVVLAQRHSVPETVEKLKQAMAARDLTVMATVDHGAGARAVQMQLRPTVLLVFGKPEVGTPLMQRSQLVGLELPLKLLVYEDEAGRVNLAWPSAAQLAERLRVDRSDPVIGKMAALYEALSREVAVP